MLAHESGWLICDVGYCSLVVCTATRSWLSGIGPAEPCLASVTVRPLLFKELTLRHQPYERGEESKVRGPYTSE
jgi:hypothetical protein